MKYIFAVICSLMLTFSLTACGGYEANQLSADSPATTAPAQTESDEQAEPTKLESTTVPQQTQSTETPKIPSSEGAAPKQTPPFEAPETSLPAEDDRVQNIQITVGSTIFSATLYDDEAAEALAKMLPLTIDMSDYSGFEKVGSLGTSLPASNSQTTAQSGDIVLYNENQIVIFYGSNSWAYTRLGKINDLSGWEEALGSSDVTVTFSME